VATRATRTAVRLIAVAHAPWRMSRHFDQDIIMTQSHDGAAGADRRAHIERTLAAYPHIDEQQLAALITWFDKEATAFDVAQLASNAAIAEPYRRLRAEHIDRLRGRDIVNGLLFAAATVGGIALLVLIV
jgi:hypothetical protein